MNRNNSNTAGRVEKVDGRQAQDSCLRRDFGKQVGRVFGFGVLGVLILTMLMAFSAGTLYAQGAWSYKKKITINATKVPATLTNFPVLISLSSDDELAASAQDDGDDIAFTIDPNETNPDNRLAHEIEYFDGNTGQLVAWVKIPTLSDITDTEIYMHYGNLICGNQQNPTGVWDSNFKMVLHLHETTGTHYDGTQYGNNGTISGTVDQNATGKIDGADSWTAEGAGIQVAHASSLVTTSAFTFETWINRSTTSDWQRIGTKQGLWAVDISNTETIRLWIWDIGDNDMYSTNTLPSGEWAHLVCVWDGTNSKVYINGAEDTEGGHSGTVTDDGNVVYIGKSYEAYGLHNATMDEVRLSNTARSADWIQTCYNNQSDQTIGPGRFIKELGAQTDSALPVELSSFTATAGDGQTTLRWATESEVDNLGFNIYRALEKEGQYIRINPELIQGAGSSPSGHDYSFTDAWLTNGVTYWYKLEDVDLDGTKTIHGPIAVTPRAAVEKFVDLPDVYGLTHSYPNPFNPGTVIEYRLPEDGYVSLKVYDALGQPVRTLVDGDEQAGYKSVWWDGGDDVGSVLGSGVYFCRLEVGGRFVGVRKMVIIR